MSLRYLQRILCNFCSRTNSKTLHACSMKRGNDSYHQKCFISTTDSRKQAEIINGNKIASEIKEEIKQDIEKLIASGRRRPHLSVILVGDNPASGIYVTNKLKAAQKTGISSETITRPSSISQQQLIDIIHQLNDNPDVDGILVQLPLPNHMNERLVCNSITPSKDVDGFHVVNVGRFCLDMNALIPCTPLGVMELLRRTGIKTFGKNAVVCGRSKNVGMPMAMLLHADGIGETQAGDATTTICHRHTPAEQLVHFTKLADILVVATGIPHLITADMVKEGACVIDIGITRIKDQVTGKSKLVGDVDFDGVVQKASYITPVPGGVGPMTVAMLMKNTYLAAINRIKY
ncbi:bifunctional methylenetetrahydrofolate dehydrogenase/cyclohydrolase, mitochondrial-like [Centruroides sculpturatus]|uniref:bifunctional methylenetetrahydrofolate dehydrogenase/cyclohydrolase, mitochondrial-like n=1 Tax=Centruroides sculpturatus TaxID=218467 RepID=UPI000C6D6B16|nr:bifunctional methylenetetrahydrofolate dehydrogenase/cyclohydrolase, mitochondrial-like [Centruroides sculpturatus]XP_023229438.1 bifunctional methylenetetrahydrofolate dehydrogenase/cyclohydrolase, mitochondrial-like [Centruroides sculpturatus]